MKITTWTYSLSNIDNTKGGLLPPTIFAKALEKQDAEALKVWNEYTQQNFPIPSPTIPPVAQPTSSEPAIETISSTAPTEPLQEKVTFHFMISSIIEEQEKQKKREQQKEAERVRLEQKEAETQKRKEQSERDKKAAQEKKEKELAAAKALVAQKQENTNQENKEKKAKKKKKKANTPSKGDADVLFLEQAIKDNRQAIIDDENNNKKNKQTVKVKAKIKDIIKKQNETDQIAPIAPEIDLLLQQAVSYFNDGQLTNAKKLFNKVVEKGLIDETINIAKVVFFQINPEEAKRVLDSIDPNTFTQEFSKETLILEKLHLEMCLAKHTPETYDKKALLERINGIKSDKKTLLEALCIYYGLHPDFQNEQLCNKTEPHHTEQCSHKKIITLCDEFNKKDFASISKTIYAELRSKGLGIEKNERNARTILEQVLNKGFYPETCILYADLIQEIDPEKASNALKKYVNSDIPGSKEKYIEFALKHPGFCCENLAYASTLVLQVKNTEERKNYIKAILNIKTTNEERMLEEIDEIKDKKTIMSIKYLVDRFPVIAQQLIDKPVNQAPYSDLNTDMNRIVENIKTMKEDNYPSTLIQLTAFMEKNKPTIETDPACIEPLRTEFVNNFDYYLSFVKPEYEQDKKLFALVLAFFSDSNNETRKELEEKFKTKFKIMN